MHKLFKLKRWLTLEETSKRLTASLGEDVSPSDCLQLAMDGHLVISVLFDKSQYGVLAEEVITTKRESLSFAIKKITSDGAYIELLNGEQFIAN